jgi:hypothetical protein
VGFMHQIRLFQHGASSNGANSEYAESCPLPTCEFGNAFIQFIHELLIPIVQCLRVCTGEYFCPRAK